nr:MAG TPA: hypothetical protein [Caudoviricetes sp.]
MPIRFGNKFIKGMKKEGKLITEAMINGQVVFSTPQTTMSFTLDIQETSLSRNLIVPFPIYKDPYPDIGNITIDWGDGTSTTIDDKIITKEKITHVYQENGQFKLRITSDNGNIPTLSFSNFSKTLGGFKYFVSVDTPLLKMYDLLNGVTPTEAIFVDFKGCENLKKIPSDLFKNNTGLEYLRDCFSECGELTIPSGIFSYLKSVGSFSNCFKDSKISKIPSNLFRNNLSVIYFDSCFENCVNLIEIPENLFKYNTNATKFSKTFKNCSTAKLNKNIFCDDTIERATRFKNQTVNFQECFYRDTATGSEMGEAPHLWKYTFSSATGTNCFGGEGNKTTLKNYSIIPKTWGGPYVENSMVWTINSGTGYLPFSPGTYQDIGNLTVDWGDGNSTTINNKIITDDNRKHTYATSGNYSITLVSNNGCIPPIKEGLWGDLTTVDTPLLKMVNNERYGTPSTYATFMNSTKLETVYYDLYQNNSHITVLDSEFASCQSLKEIPEELFSSLINVTTFDYTFYNCKNGVQNIPENLFKSNTKATIFSHAFDKCYIEEIPQNLFRYNINAKSFDSTFYNCPALKEVPEYLFRYNVDATNFTNTFSTNFFVLNTLTINKNIFCNDDVEKSIRFKGKTMNFNGCFYQYKKTLAGTAPELWDYTYDSADGSDCFYAEDNKLSNLENIPDSWK